MAPTQLQVHWLPCRHFVAYAEDCGDNYSPLPVAERVRAADARQLRRAALPYLDSAISACLGSEMAQEVTVQRVENVDGPELSGDGGETTLALGGQHDPRG